MARHASKAHQVYTGLMERGWYPAQWKHHPAPIKEAIRRFGWRPQVKQCFANCQRFILDNATTGPGLAVEYREGYVQTLIPIEHAWLIYEGEPLDLTLDPDIERVYLDSAGYSVADIRKRIVTAGSFGPVDQIALNKLSPFYPEFQRLMDLQGRGEE